MAEAVRLGTSGDRIGHPLSETKQEFDVKTLLELLDAKTDKTPGQGPNGDCWGWTGTRNKQGYGTLYWDGQSRPAHRLRQIAAGKNLTGLCSCHTCDNPPCSNPAHLFVGTHSENARDAVKKGRLAAVGASNNRAKVTQLEVEALRAFTWRDVLRATDMKDVVGLGKSQINYIINRQRW